MPTSTCGGRRIRVCTWLCVRVWLCVGGWDTYFRFFSCLTVQDSIESKTLCGKSRTCMFLAIGEYCAMPFGRARDRQPIHRTARITQSLSSDVNTCPGHNRFGGPVQFSAPSATYNTGLPVAGIAHLLSAWSCCVCGRVVCVGI